MEFSDFSVLAGPGRSYGAGKLPPDYSRLGDLAHHYDPNQPRVPAGHPEGGQWTSGWLGSNLTSSRSKLRTASTAPAVSAAPSANVPITYPTASQRMSDFGAGIAKGIAQQAADLLWNAGVSSACEAGVPDCLAMFNDGPPQLFGPPASIAEKQGRMIGPLMLLGLSGPRGAIGGGAEAKNPLSGPVVVRRPLGATADELVQLQAYVNGSNDALAAGRLSPTGRVSTAGQLRTDASLAAAEERARAAAEGVAYEGHVGHVPDTTWTGNPQPYKWLDLTPRLNSSLGGQAVQYPLGYRPTTFVVGGQ